MSRITITGANGFIGNRLMLRLSGYENSISSIDEDYFNDTDWIVTLLDLLNSQNPEIISRWCLLGYSRAEC
jgi:nucleoside-diphosphate-sugar epimerase